MSPRRRKSPESVSQSSAEQGFLQSTRSRVIASLVVGGALAGVFLSSRPGSETDTDSVHAESGKPSPVFNPETYAPPVEGRIWKKRIMAPDKQTVVYIPDIHGMSGDPKASEVQQEIFAIVEDGIQKYGKVPIVLEEWVDYGQGAAYDRCRHIRGNMLEAIADEPKTEGRRLIANELIKKGKGRAPTLLPVVYPEQVIPVASKNGSQEFESTAVATQFFSVADILRDNAPCRFFNSGVDMGVGDVIDSPERFGEAVDCYCTFDELFRVSQGAFRQNRSFDSPGEEVRRATVYDENFVYIITGTAHTDETVRQLEARGVNYFVVAPRSNDMPETVLETFPEADPHCTEWAEAHHKALEATLRNYRGAFRTKTRMILEEVEAEAGCDAH